MSETSETLKYMFQDFLEQYKFISKNYTLNIRKQDLIDILPISLNHGKRAQKLLNCKSNHISPELVIKLLKHQTVGRDFVSYQMFIDRYNLEIDNNHMIVFTSDFKPIFQNYNKCADLKQEPFIIDWVLRILSSHKIIKAVS
jgi:hypothetical protein